MNKNYNPVYVRGTKSGIGVIEALVARGGINNCDYKGNSETNLYYIDPNTNFIYGINEHAQFAPYIKATADEIIPLKWRAERRGVYYTIDSTMLIIESTEDGDKYDKGRYKSGNYFRTKKEAEEALAKIKKILSE